MSIITATIINGMAPIKPVGAGPRKGFPPSTVKNIPIPAILLIAPCPKIAGTQLFVFIVT